MWSVGLAQVQLRGQTAASLAAQTRHISRLCDP